MEPIFFAPTVLQRYATDPHYYFRFHDFGGTLGTEDEFYLSEALPAGRTRCSCRRLEWDGGMVVRRRLLSTSST